MRIDFDELELSSGRCRKSGRRANANACQPKYWLNGDNERSGDTRCTPKITMAHVRLRVRFFSTTARAVGSENASRHCSASSNAVVNSDDDCLNGDGPG